MVEIKFQMPKDIVENIGKQLRKVRKEREMTLQELADRAGVTKGLLSRIENVRTIPSLPVLMSIIQALGLDIKDFFAEVDTEREDKIIICRKADLEPTTKEDAIGFQYFNILNQSLGDMLIKTTILELVPGSNREKVVTDGYEFKYIIEGTVEYKIENETYELQEGDSLFFDARLPHVPVNNSDKIVRMLVIYFLQSGK